MPLQSHPKTLFNSALTKVIKNIDLLCEREKQKERGKHLSDLRKLFSKAVEKFNFTVFDIVQLPTWPK